MSIAPKSTRVVYRGIEAKVTYQPDTKRWKWEFVIVHRITLNDYEDSEKAAVIAVKKEIDSYNKSQEKAARKL